MIFLREIAKYKSWWILNSSFDFFLNQIAGTAIVFLKLVYCLELSCFSGYSPCVSCFLVLFHHSIKYFFHIITEIVPDRMTVWRPCATCGLFCHISTYLHSLHTERGNNCWLIDWLIDWLNTPHLQYFSHMTATEKVKNTAQPRAFSC